MKLFIDTNVILDLLEKREPFVEDALYLFQQQALGHVLLLATDLSIVNMAYITRKSYPRELFYAAISKLRPFLEIIPMGAEAIDEVLRLQPKDLEDGVQYFAARRMCPDYIITRNKRDFPFSDIPVLTPMEFHTMFETKGAVE